jgi:hypothetical protein
MGGEIFMFYPDTLWLFNIAMVKPWPIEIDGLPSNKKWVDFPWQTGNVITRWYPPLSMAHDVFRGKTRGQLAG